MGDRMFFVPLFLEYQVGGGKPDTFPNFISLVFAGSSGENCGFCDLTRLERGKKRGG
jgi:hypothetical protein